MRWKTAILIAAWVILFSVGGILLGWAAQDAPPPAPVPSQVGAVEDL
jgi:hypothetical protein